MHDELTAQLRAACRAEPLLFWIGGLGLFLGAVCFGAIIVHGPVVEPEGHLLKAGTFDGAVGLFVLTLALVLPVARLSTLGRRVWVGALVPLVLFGYAVETVQIFRGFDPRFSRVSSPLDQMIGGLFFLSAIGILICFVALMARFFVRSTDGDDGALVLSLRYGAIAAVLAFGVGIAMSVLGGPRVAPEGNLLPLHAAGFHGMQAVPLVALLLIAAGAPGTEALRSVHVAGLAWIGATLAIGGQSFGGSSVLAPAPLTALALALLVVWAVICARAALRSRRATAMVVR